MLAASRLTLVHGQMGGAIDASDDLKIISSHLLGIKSQVGTIAFSAHSLLPSGTGVRISQSWIANWCVRVETHTVCTRFPST